MQIPDIKSSLSILSVLRYFGIVPDKSGMVSCPDPNHQDKHPSCRIYEKTNTFFCFSCGAKGDQIQLIEFLQGQGKHKAILTAKEILGHVPPMKNNKTHHIMDTLSPKQLKETLRLFFEKAATSYKKSANAQGYCKKRNIDGHKLGLGFVGATFFRHYTDKQRDMAIKAGILKKHREGSFKSKFTNCIIFPLYNTDGEITYIYGRSISGSDKFKHVLLGGSYIGIYPCFPDKNIKRIILTEGFGDCATLLTHSNTLPEDTTVIPLFSAVGGFTDEIKQAVSGQNIEEIIQFYDGDKAGGDAIKTNTGILEKLNGAAIISSVECPENEDINSLLEGHEPEILAELIAKRKIIRQPAPQQVQKHGSTQGELSLVANGEAKPVKEENNEGGGEPATELIAKKNGELLYQTSNATYLIKGGVKDKFDSLKITLEIKPVQGKRSCHRKPDLYDDDQIEKTAREVGERLNIRPELIEEDLYNLIPLLEAWRLHVLAEKEEKRREKYKVPEAHYSECLSFLKDSNLLNNFYLKMSEGGITGEKHSRMLVFSIASSVGMPKTLHGIIIGNSGKGKTYLMTTICEMMPPELFIDVTTLTDKSLFNKGKYGYQGCIIVVEDRTSLTDEVKLYFRELQSKEKISRDVVRGDGSGHFNTVYQEVLGPMTSLSCTTEEELLTDDENRCFLIAVDESQEQTERIIKRRNQVAAGLIDSKSEDKAKEFIRNCIRMLKPYKVINPFAPYIELPKMRDKNRFHGLFLRLVDQITILHQYQREQRNGRLIATIDDVDRAIDIMFDALWLKVDDIGERYRKIMEQLKAWVQSQGGEKYKDYRFKQSDVRKALMINAETLKKYLQVLVELEQIEIVNHNKYRGHLYKIICWDNIEQQRNLIKSHLKQQVEQLREQKSK